MKLIFGFLSLLVVMTSSLSAAFYDWRVLESPHYRLYYQFEYQASAMSWLHRLEEDRKVVTTNLQTDSRKVPVILENAGLIANGSVTMFPPRMRLFSAPPVGPNIYNMKNWSRLLVTHEQTHIEQLTEVDSYAGTFYRWFGTYFLPHNFTPEWLVEGLAVDMESRPINSRDTNPQGRLNDGYFQAIVASQATGDLAKSLPEITSTLPTRFPVDYTYVYGSVFMNYLRTQYGQEPLASFIQLQGENIWAPIGFIAPSVTLDRAAKKAYGKSFKALYEEWQAVNAKNYKSWTVTGERLTTTGWQKNFLATDGVSLFYMDTEVGHHSPLLFNFTYHLKEYDPSTGVHKVVKSFLSPVISPIQYYNGHLYYLRANVESGYINIEKNGFGGVSHLFKLDPYTGKETKLASGEIRAFAILEDGRILYSKALPFSENSEVTFLQDDLSTVIGELPLLISEMVTDGQDVYLVAKPQNYTSNLYHLSVANFTYKPILEVPFTLSYLSRQGDKLTFTSNQNKKHSIYTLDLKTKQLTHRTDSDYARAGVYIGATLYFVGLTATGEDIFEHGDYSLTTSIVPEKVSPFTPKLYEKATDRERGFERSARSLFYPYNRIIPTLLSGADELGLHEYRVMLNSETGVSVGFFSRIFLPTTIGVATLNDHSFFVLHHPFLRSLDKGLQSIDFNLRTNFDDVIPGLALTYSIPYHTTRFLAESNLTNSSFRTQLNHEYRFQGHKAVRAMVNQSDGIDTFVHLRGDHWGLVDEAKGTTGYLEYTQRLFALQKGLWSPSFYGGDLFGVLFYDYADLGRTRTSYGIQTKLESSIFLGNFHFIPSVGAAVVDNEITPFAEVEFNLAF